MALPIRWPILEACNHSLWLERWGPTWGTPWMRPLQKQTVACGENSTFSSQADGPSPDSSFGTGLHGEWQKPVVDRDLQWDGSRGGGESPGHRVAGRWSGGASAMSVSRGLSPRRCPQCPQQWPAHQLPALTLPQTVANSSPAWLPALLPLPAPPSQVGPPPSQRRRTGCCSDPGQSLLGTGTTLAHRRAGSDSQCSERRQADS